MPRGKQLQIPEYSGRRRIIRRTVAVTLSWIAAAALYLLLIDITSEPELLVGAGVALLPAAGLELRHQPCAPLELGLGGLRRYSFPARWLGITISLLREIAFCSPPGVATSTTALARS